MSAMTNMHVPPSAGHEYLLDLTRAAYERSGTHLDRDVVDLQLLDTVDKAACSLLRDQWTDGFPVAAYTELLTTVAALRAVLGYSPTPTAVDVNAWALSVREASAEAAGSDRNFHEVRVVEGPHKGALLGVWGPRTAQTPDTAPGPLLSLALPIEHGDSADMEFGMAHYRRRTHPHPSSGQWEYMLDRNHSRPGADCRPRFLPAPAQSHA